MGVELTGVERWGIGRILWVGCVVDGNWDDSVVLWVGCVGHGELGG